MKNKYLTQRERYKIEAYLKANYKVKEIAMLLDKCVSTIYREIHLGTIEFLNSDLTTRKEYVADAGQRIQDERSHNKGKELKIGNDLELIRYLEHKIKTEHYSPVAVLEEIKKEQLNFKTDICFKTVYNYVHNGIFLNLTIRDLPCPRKGKDKKNSNKNIARNHSGLHTSIEERPAEIKSRSEYGHWELDSVESGKGDKTCLFVLTERATREELIFKSPAKSARELVKTLNRLERQLTPKIFRETFKTITVDNGAEFLKQEEIEKSCINKTLPRTKVYYCHPYNASERGSNENANRLIRRWIPKGTYISQYSDSYIKNIEMWMNNYPRKIFGFRSALEEKQRLLC